MASTVRTPSDQVSMIAAAIIDSGGRPSDIDALGVSALMSTAIDVVLGRFTDREREELRNVGHHPAPQPRVIMQRVLEFRLSRAERELARQR